MRKEDRRGTKMGLLIMVLAALFLLNSPMFLQTQIWGLDSDGDGFNDESEISEITLDCKEELSDTSYNVPITFQKCQTGWDRKECVDPNSKDVFLILKQIDPLILRPGNPDYDSNFDLYEFIRNSKEDDGLGINVIDVLASNPDLEDCSQRVIDEFPDYIQGAVLIEEIASDPMGYFGDSDWTSPDGFGVGRVFTQAISDYVEDNCDKSEVCKDHNTEVTDRNEIIRLYIRHTMCHEIAHLLKLKYFWDHKFGVHYGTSRKTILEEHITMTSKGPPGNPSIEFFITNNFTGADFDNATLTEY